MARTKPSALRARRAEMQAAKEAEKMMKRLQLQPEDLTDIVGEWDVERPQTVSGREEWSVSFERDSDDQLIGTFLLGVNKGLMHLKNTDDKGCSFTFTWQGRDSREGEPLKDAEKTGSIKITDEGKLEGIIRTCTGYLEFTGLKLSNLPAITDVVKDEVDEED